MLKGLLKRIFWDDHSNEARRPIGADMPKLEPAHVNRDARIELLPLHNVTFRPEDTKTLGDRIQLANVSYGGIGLLRKDLKRTPDSTQDLLGSLNVNEKEIPIRLSVAHVTDEIVGCALIEVSVELRRFLKEYFDLEMSATSMSPVDPSTLRQDKLGKPHWYIGSNNCELYLLEQGGDPVYFRLSFFGNLLEYKKDSPLRYGFTFDHALETTEREANITQTALKFVANIRQLPQEHRHAVQSIIEKMH